MDRAGRRSWPGRRSVRWLGWGGCFAFVACAASEQEMQPAAEALAMDLAEVLVASHSYDVAVPLLRRGIAKNPEDAKLHELLGVVLREKGIYDEAEAELKVALKLQPNSANIHAALGILSAAQGDLERAEKYGRRAIELNKDRAAFHNNLGFVLYLQGRPEEAVTAYTHALRIDPSQRRCYNNLGFAQARLGNFVAAFRSFEEAGSRAAAYANLGLAYELAGKLKMAEQSYRRALGFDGSLTVARRNLERLTQSAGAAEPEVSGPSGADSAPAEASQSDPATLDTGEQP